MSAGTYCVPTDARLQLGLLSPSGPMRPNRRRRTWFWLLLMFLAGFPLGLSTILWL